MFTAAFWVSQWSGQLAHDVTESYAVQWWSLAQMPPLAPETAERLTDFRRWAGRVLVK